MLPYLTSGLLLLGLLAPSFAWGGEKPVSILAKQWEGGRFAEKQGGAYVAFKFSGFTTQAGASYAPESAEVTLYNVLTEQYFLFQQSEEPRFGPPAVIWKLPSGKYRVIRLAAVDMRGQMRFWTPDKNFPVAFLISRQIISNLGRWTIQASGAKDLKVTYEATPNRYHYTKKDDSTPPVAGVIDGAKGLVQEVIGGKKTIEEAKNNDGPTVQTQHRVRNIQMFRTVDLMRQNRFAKKLSTFLSTYDGKIRECYRNMLEKKGDSSGVATFAFLLSREAAHIKKMKFETGDLSDPTFVGCVMTELQAATLPLEETVLGRVTYKFEVSYD